MCMSGRGAKLNFSGLRRTYRGFLLFADTMGDARHLMSPWRAHIFIYFPIVD